MGLVAIAIEVSISGSVRAPWRVRFRLTFSMRVRYVFRG